MKGLTLWQPWASLMGQGKHHETRSWSTKYRGPIAIHAALKKPFINDLTKQTRTFIKDNLGEDWISDLPLGAIISIAYLTDCKRVEMIDTDPIDRLLGNYNEGRWAWEFSNIIILSKPFPIRGHPLSCTCTCFISNLRST